jgi:hypothetical protein
MQKDAAPAQVFWWFFALVMHKDLDESRRGPSRVWRQSRELTARRKQRFFQSDTTTLGPGRG